jgi:hypothetical protein
MMQPYVKFELNVCNHCRDDEWKLKVSIYFSKFKRDNSVTNQQTITKFKLDLHILMTNLHMQLQSYTCIKTKFREWKQKISIFFKVQEGQLSQKSMNLNHIRTWPAYSYDVSTHTMSTLYIHTNKSYRAEIDFFPKPNSNLTCVILRWNG